MSFELFKKMGVLIILKAPTSPSTVLIPLHLKTKNTKKQKTKHTKTLSTLGESKQLNTQVKTRCKENEEKREN